MLANRLCKVIDNVIFKSQSALIKERQILVENFIANEVVDETRKLNELLLFKVDFEKTYDLVYYNYLQVLLRKMNFRMLRHKWIIEYVCRTRTSFFVNGSPTDDFFFKRALRQGDPLSLFFWIAHEGLNIMLNTTVEVGLFFDYIIV